MHISHLFSCTVTATSQRCHNTTAIERRPLVNEYWERSDPHYIDGKRAESFAGLLERVGQMWQKLSDEYYANKWVVIYSHGQFIRAALWYWLSAQTRLSKQSMKHYRSFSDAFPIANTAILKMRYGSEVWFSPVQTTHIPTDLLTEEIPAIK